MKSALLFVLGMLVLAGCASAPKYDVKAALGEEFSIAPDQTAYIASENLLVNFVNVTEDSRCPSDVVCVWAGQAVAVLQFSKEDRVFFPFTNITIGGSGEASSNVNIDGKGYLLNVTKLEPYPKSTDGSRKYVVKMKITKN